MRPTLIEAGTRTADVVCIGECMVMFVPEQPGVSPPRLPRYRPTIAGAESNVAGNLTSLGVSAAWVSRLGTDAFGDYIDGELDRLGVAVRSAPRDSHRRTGIAFKDWHGGGTRVRYYREGSAASAMGDETRETAIRLGGRILHLSGITPALSDSCRGLIRDLMLKRESEAIVSFDVNWRPRLWHRKDPSLLLELARAADIVFVGDDEAAALWSVDTVREVRALLPDVSTLVVKHGARGATVDAGGTQVFVPALDIEVVEAVGAGDAFAAGYLAGVLDGLDLRSCARLGTILAATTLGTTSDIAPPPPSGEINRMLSLTDVEWKTATLESDLSYLPEGG